MRKWSVSEFEGLIRHQLTDTPGPVELVDGKIVPLPGGEQIDRQIALLVRQIEQHLNENGLDGFEVRSHYPIYIDNHSVLKPAITLVEPLPEQTRIHWALDIFDAPTDDALRAATYAKCKISEYWNLRIDQVELRIKTAPCDTSCDASCDASYQRHQLLMVGEQSAPSLLPQLQLRVQEPLPMYFLTRTSKGQRTYIGEGVALQVTGVGG